MLTVIYFKHRNDINQHLKTIVTKSVRENLEVQRIALIPGIGKQIVEALDSSISNITFNVIDNSIEDIAKSKSIPAINDITDYLIQQLEQERSDNKELSELMKGIIVDTLEMIKQQIEVKTWRIKELTDKKATLLKKINSGRGNLKSIQTKINMIEKEILELENP